VTLLVGTANRIFSVGGESVNQWSGVPGGTKLIYTAASSWGGQSLISPDGVILAAPWMLLRSFRLQATAAFNLAARSNGADLRRRCVNVAARRIRCSVYSTRQPFREFPTHAKEEIESNVIVAVGRPIVDFTRVVLSYSMNARSIFSVAGYGGVQSSCSFNRCELEVTLH
jgi:hypothetical protein